MAPRIRKRLSVCGLMEPIILQAGCCCRCLKYTLLSTTATVTSSFTQPESNIVRCAHGTQTHNVLVSTRISALTANLVVGQPADCSVFCSMLCVVLVAGHAVISTAVCSMLCMLVMPRSHQ